MYSPHYLKMLEGRNGYPERTDGFGLEPELHHVLRSRPPAAVLAWVLKETGAERVGRVRALAGGRSSAVHMVHLESATGAHDRVVLRRFVLDWLAEEPEAPGNEARVLDLLAHADPAVPAPRLLASDPEGAVTGAPATLMTAVPGRVDWGPSDLESWLRRLAEALPRIHAVTAPPDLATFVPWAPDLVPPPWTRHRRAWLLALELYHRPVPSSERVFVHRDYHPGNVLWTRRRVTGIVDWISSCAGPPEADVAHCRQDLAEHFDTDVADRFLQIWVSVTGRTQYDPYFDLTNAVSTVNATPNPAVDEFVARAAARFDPA